MFGPHRSNLNVEMTANKCGSGEPTNASSQLNVARLLYANTFHYSDSWKMLHLYFRNWTPLENFPLDLFLYIALLANSTSKHCMQHWGRGGEGFTLRTLTRLSPKTARDEGSVHYISSWPQVSHTKWLSQALLIHLSTNLHRGPGILFSFNPRSRALAQTFQSLSPEARLHSARGRRWSRRPTCRHGGW